MSDANVQVARQVTRAIKRESMLVAGPVITQNVTAAIAVELKPLIESVQRTLQICSGDRGLGWPGQAAIFRSIKVDLGNALAGSMLHVAVDDRPAADFGELAATMDRIQYWAQTAKGDTDQAYRAHNTIEAIEQVSGVLRELCLAESRRAAAHSDVGKPG